MGNEKLVKIDDGVYIREYQSGRTAIMLQFAYRGVRNREYLAGLDPSNKSHIKQAKYKIGAIHEAIAQNRFNYREFFPGSNRAKIFEQGVSLRTVREIGACWLRDMKKSKPHSTYRAYAYPTEKVIFEAIGDLPIRSVMAEDIREIFRNLDIGLKTANNYSLPLRAIFNRAMADEDIDKNPMDRVNFHDLISDTKKRSDHIVDPLTEDEIEKFLKACAEHRPEWLNYWTVAIYTGLRTSELFGLEWQDCMGDQLFVVRAQVYGEDKRPKTAHSSRSVDLTPAAKAALKRQSKITRLYGSVFWNPNTKGMLSYKVAQAAFDYICGRAGIKRRQAYQTRHTFASNMLSLGENALYVAAQMGHKDTTTLFKKYARWVSAEKYTRKSGFGASDIAP